MVKDRTNHIVRGAFILTMAGLLSKVLSATYRIPLQNLTGDFGFYIYQQVYPLLGTVMILALYGFPTAISKLTAEQTLESKPLTTKSFYLPLFLILLMINGVFFIILYSLAPVIVTWMGDEQLLRSFRFAAFLFLLIPFIALVRGVTQGKGMMQQTAYSQIVEQLIRVTIIITASYLIFIEKLDIYQIGEAGVLATLLGMVMALLVFIWFVPKRKHRSLNEVSTNIPWKYYLMTCLLIGVLATFNHLILLLMQMVDTLTIVPSLTESGFSPVKAMETKGVFDRGQPLIQFGVVFGSSFALALIPNVVRKQSKNTDEQTPVIRDAFLFGFYITLGATLGLFALMPETNILLFTNSDGTSSLQILSLTLVLTALSITGAAVLQSIGHIKSIVYSVTGAVAMKFSLNVILVPVLDIRGSAIATVCSMLFLTLIIFAVVDKKISDIRFLQHIRWKALLIASVSMVLYIYGLRFVFLSFIDPTRWMLLIYILFVIGTGAMLYLVVLLRYQVLSDKQIQALPFSTIILRVKDVVEKRG